MDAVILILAMLALAVPFIIAKLYWWVGFWCCLAIVLAIFELIAYIFTKKTISQQFWYWRKNVAKPWQKWLIFGGMVAFWIYLLAHLFL